MPAMQWREVSLLGIDVGYSIRRATTGVAVYTDGKLAKLQRIKYGETARSDALAGNSVFDVIAIDGPILPAGAIETRARLAESLLSRGVFSRRCKPAASHHGFGLTFRRETLPFLVQLTPLAKQGWLGYTHEQVVPRRAVVEAFPNAFLGFLIPGSCFPAPQLGRGRKFDWLYEQAASECVFETVLDFLGWHDDDLSRTLATESDHEKRAALVCLLTAACALTGCAEPVGDKSGGWIFLPPKELWAPWARDAMTGSP